MGGYGWVGGPAECGMGAGVVGRCVCVDVVCVLVFVFVFVCMACMV